MEGPSEGHKGNITRESSSANTDDYMLSPTAQPGSFKSSENDQKRKSKREIDMDYRNRKKNKEQETMMELERLENCNTELETEHASLKQLKAQMDEKQADKFSDILDQLQCNIVVGQNTDEIHSNPVQESSDLQNMEMISTNTDDILIDLPEDIFGSVHWENSCMNPLTLSPSAQRGRITTENSSMNPQIHSPSAQPGSSKITGKEKKKEADKKSRDKKKLKIDTADKRIEELKVNNFGLEKEIAVMRSQVDGQLQKSKELAAIEVALMKGKAAREETAAQLLETNLFQGSNNLRTWASTSATNSSQNLPAGWVQAKEELKWAFYKFIDYIESIHEQ